MGLKFFKKRIKSFRAFIYLYSYIISPLSFLFNRKKHPEDYKRILIIRVDYLGDAVITTPFLSAVRLTFGNADITFVVERKISKIFERDGNIDKIMGIDRKLGFRQGVNLISLLLKNRYQLVFDLSLNWWSVVYGTIMIPFARRYDRESMMIPGVIKRNWLVFTGHNEREFKREHEVIRALKMIRDFYDINDVPDTYLPLPRNAERIFANLASSYGIKKQKYFLVAPGSQWEVRRWDINKFAEAAKVISARYDLPVVITGVKSEIEVCDKLYRLIEGRAINLAGEISLEEFLVLVANSALLIGNDSGPVHVGAGLKVPVVAVMGTADVEVFKPWGENVRVCYRKVLCGPCYSGECYMPQNICLQPVTIREVVEASSELLEKTDRR